LPQNEDGASNSSSKAGTEVEREGKVVTQIAMKAAAAVGIGEPFQVPNNSSQVLSLRVVDLSFGGSSRPSREVEYVDETQLEACLKLLPSPCPQTALVYIKYFYAI
jgi:hypothetical protein